MYELINLLHHVNVYFRDISIKNKYAFVDFDDVKDAEDAVYYLHKKEFMGEIVSCFVILESASLLNSHKCSITCYLCYDLYHAVTIV